MTDFFPAEHKNRYLKNVSAVFVNKVKVIVIQNSTEHILKIYLLLRCSDERNTFMFG